MNAVRIDPGVSWVRIPLRPRDFKDYPMEIGEILLQHEVASENDMV
jgi:hypothetical protein